MLDTFDLCDWEVGVPLMPVWLLKPTPLLPILGVQLATLPTSRSGLAAGSLQGRIYVFGGEGGGIHAENEEYNPSTNTWRSMPDMPVPRHGFTACCMMDGMIFLPGGAIFEGLGPTNVMDAFSINVISGVSQATVPLDHYSFISPDREIVIQMGCNYSPFCGCQTL